MSLLTTLTHLLPFGLAGVGGEEPTLFVGDPAPPFAVERFLRGEPARELARGTVYVIEFWTVWCGPCVAGMPHLSELQRRHRERGLCVIGVAPRPDEWGHDLGSIEELLARKADVLDHSIALDAPGPSKDGYQGVFRGRTLETWMGAAGVGAVPIAFVIDREGRIAAIATPTEIDDVVEACLDGTFERDSAAREYRARLAEIERFGELKKHWQEGERELSVVLAGELLEGPLRQDARYLTALADLLLGAGAGAAELELAQRAAARAVELTHAAEPGALFVLARTHCRRGEANEGRRLARAAIEMAEGGFRRALEEELARSCPAAGGDGRDLEAALDELVRGYADAGEFSGVVLVAKGERLLLRKAYGYADATRGIPTTVEARFHLASLTKTFTAAAVLTLAAEGKLALSDPVARFLPDYPRGQEITLRALLAHQAGIPDHHALPGFAERTRGRVSAREMVEFAQPFPLDFAPGSQHRYSNSNYTLLAYLIECISGKAYDAFLRERIYAPLELHTLGPAPLEARAPERVLGHEPAPGERAMRPVEQRDYSYAVGTGALEATAADLLSWMRAIDARLPVDLFAEEWPYGWGRRERFGKLCLEQTGLHDGFTTVMAFYPEEDLYLVQLSNLLACRAWHELPVGLVALVLDQLLEWPEHAPVVALARTSAERCVGRYRHPAGFEFGVELAPDGLCLRGIWGDSTRLRHLDPLGPLRFRHRGDGAELTFSDDEGPAREVEWLERGSRVRCPRLDGG